MNIILITDLHIGQEGEDTHGVDVRQNFLNILKTIKKEDADYLIVAGDLCYLDGDKSVYQWIKKHLDNLDIPYDVLVGNHDKGEDIAEVFNYEESFKNGNLYYKRQIKDWQALFLDTSVGSLSKDQQDWLNKELQEADEPSIIFMHHPPIIAGVEYMDTNHALENRTEVQTILRSSKYPIPVFTGHYHVEKTICLGKITVQITPSCYVQIDQINPTFKADHHQIAYRKIELEEDRWKSTVRYLEGAKL